MTPVGPRSIGIVYALADNDIPRIAIKTSNNIHILLIISSPSLPIKKPSHPSRATWLSNEK
jgi:hypothetical protein